MEELKKYVDDNLYNVYSYKIDAHRKSNFKYSVKSFNIEKTYITDISNMNGVKNINVVIIFNVVSDNQMYGGFFHTSRIARGINFVKRSKNENNICNSCSNKFSNTIFKCPKCGKIVECSDYTWIMVKDELLSRY